MPSEPDAPRFRPRDYLRRRRPGYFSDTPAAIRPRLDRAVLDYHLSTLTSRSEELDFEKFARSLCQRTIARNLLPHTGPSGGGDSKVDTETYPVSPDLALSWYVGEPERASQERWGFAFSAKADWMPKLKADVAKIAATGRAYDRAYFVSSQLIRDRERAGVEDSLRTKYGFDVRIFDRNWVLDAVFDGHQEALAVEALGLQVELLEQPRPGPLDASRQHRLVEVEEEIKSAVEAGEIGPRVVDLAIEAAVIARELEGSREEIEGRLDRAGRLADRHGLRPQEALVAYERAWTGYWWFEDGPSFARYVEEHERLVGAAADIPGLRRLVTLYYLVSAGIAGSWTPDPAWAAARRTVVDAEIARISAMVTAPSASLSARMLAFMLQALDDPENADDAYRGMTDLVDQARGLIGFAFEEFADELTELGSVITASAAFDALHGRLVEEVQRRAGGVAAGELHTERASHLYDGGRYADAITSAGKALPLLFEHEARRSLIRALDVIGDSYLQMGLPWAARGAWLLASSLLGSEVVASPAELPRLVAMLDRIRGVELFVGRLPQALSVHRICALAASAVAVDTANIRGLLADRDTKFEIALAYALMRQPHAAIRRLSRAPDMLGRYGLDLARSALLFALGHEGEVSDAVGTREEAVELLRTLREVPEGPELMADQFGSGRTAVLATRVLGVTIRAEYDRGSPAAEIAESCLGATEALLATGVGLGIFGRVPELRLTVRKGHFTPWPFRVVSGGARGNDGPIEIAYTTFDPAVLTALEQAAIRDPLREVVTRIMARGFYLGPTDEALHRLFGDERALERALNFAASFVTVGDLMGETQAQGLGALLDGTERNFLLSEDQPEWTKPADGPPRNSAVQSEDRGALDMRTLPHDQMRVMSVIDVPLWDAARWSGVLFGVAPGAPPLMALLFRNASAARDILAGWKRRLGSGDLNQLLRISIVTHLTPDQPYRYRVLVGSQLNATRGRKDRVLFETVRMHEMTPASDVNLRRFKDAYAEFGRFQLGVGTVGSDLTHAAGARVIDNMAMVSVAIRALSELTEDDWEFGLASARMGDGDA